MKSAYRTRIRKTLQSLDESGIVLERITPDQVEAAAAEIYGLYHQVHDRKKLSSGDYRGKVDPRPCTSLSERFSHRGGPPEGGRQDPRLHHDYPGRG